MSPNPQRWYNSWKQSGSLEVVAINPLPHLPSLMSPMLWCVDIVLVYFSCHCLHFWAYNQCFLYSRVQLQLTWWGMKEAHVIPAQLSPYPPRNSCVFTQVAFPYCPNSGSPVCPFAWRTAKTRTLRPLLGRSAVSHWRARSLPLKWKTTQLTVNPRLTESLAGVCCGFIMTRDSRFKKEELLELEANRAAWFLHHNRLWLHNSSKRADCVTQQRLYDPMGDWQRGRH